MKKLFIFLAVSILSFCACNKYDDTELKQDIKSLSERLDKVEELCRNMNSNIDALQKAVSALEKNVSVSKVTQDANGYTIYFSDGTTATIKNGETGAAGSTPVIGVAISNDGRYYWTINGQWLLDSSGNMIPTTGNNGKDGNDGADGKDGAAGKNGNDGITPQLKIVDDYWYVSTDGGLVWTKLSKATGENGDSMFASVTVENNFLLLTLKDGSVIKLPMAQALNLVFANTSIFSSATDMDVDFSIEGATSNTKVVAFAGQSISVKVELKGIGTGVLHVHFADEDWNGNAMVVASDGDCTSMRVLEFEKGSLTSSTSDTINVGYDGGSVSLVISHNMKIAVSSNVDWITSTDTKTVMTDQYVFNVSKNDGMDLREGVITASSEDKLFSLNFKVSQKAQEKLLLDVSTLALGAEDSYSFKVTTNVKETLVWSTSDSNVATVDQSGKVTGVMGGKAVITVSTADKRLSATCTVTVKAVYGYINGHKYVDLGLPSGALWSVCNYGSSTETGSGSYMFWSTRKVVTSGWGDEWSAPSRSDFSELLNNCSYEWTTKSGVNGYLFKGSNGGTVFFPAAGWKPYVSGYGYGSVQSYGQQLIYWATDYNSQSGTTFACSLSGSSTSISCSSTYNTEIVCALIRPIAK